MKYLLAALFLIFTFSKSVSAIPTASPSGRADIDKLEKIRELKEKVAEKVLQLRKQKIVYFGEIIEIDKSSFSLSTNEGNKTIEVTENTNYYWVNTNKKILSLNFSNLEKGDYISVWSENDENDNYIAQSVIGKVPIFFLSGEVTKIVKNGQSFIISFTGKKTEMSVIVSNKANISFIKKQEIVSGKIIDIIIGQKIFCYASYKEGDKEQIQAQRIIIDYPIPAPTNHIEKNNN